MSRAKIRIRTSSFVYLPGMYPRGPLTMKFLALLGPGANKYRMKIFKSFYNRCYRNGGEAYAEEKTLEVLSVIACLTEEESKCLMRWT